MMELSVSDASQESPPTDTGRDPHPGIFDPHWRLCWGLIALAIALRFLRYVHDRGLWLDEVYLALNLVNRSFSELALELDDLQYAPLGFLVVMKLCVVAFGSSEWAFRLFPLAASLISIAPFYGLAKRVLKPGAVPLALLLYALSFPLLVYSAEAKVYGVDAAIAVALVFVAVMYANEPIPRLRNALLVAAVGASAVWFSFPAAFVLAGIGISLALPLLLRRNWRGLGFLSLAIAIWSISFAAQAWLMIGRGEPQLPASDLGGLQRYYSEDFLPWPPRPAAVAEWLMYFCSTLSGYFTSEVAAGVGVFAFVMGCLPMAKGQRQALAMLIAPLVITLLVSATQLYPTRDRFMVFIGPALLLVMAAGFDEIRMRVGAQGRIVWILLLVVLLFQPSLRAVKQSIAPERHGDSRAAVARLDEQVQEGDVLFLHWTADPQYRFYSKHKLPAENVIVGSRSESWDKMIRDVELLPLKPRVWVLFSFNAQTTPAGRTIRQYLKSNGRLLDTFESQKTALYLYDMSAGPEPAAP